MREASPGFLYYAAALANTVITNESNIFITGKLAALIRVDD